MKNVLLISFFALISCSKNKEPELVLVEKTSTYMSGGDLNERLDASEDIAKKRAVPPANLKLDSNKLEPIKMAKHDDLAAAWDYLERQNKVAAANILNGLLIQKRNNGVWSREFMLRDSLVRRAEVMLAMSKLGTSKEQEALDQLEELIVLNPKWFLPYLVLGDNYIRRKSFLLAEKVARTGIDRVAGSESIGLVNLRAKALWAAGRKDTAVQVIESGLRQYPSDAGLMVWKGIFLEDAGNTSDACEYFAVAHERGPELIEASYNYARCLTQQGSWVEAEGVLKSSMMAYPHVARLKLLFAKVEKGLGRLSEARKAWEDFLAMADADDSNRAFVEAELAWGLAK